MRAAASPPERIRPTIHAGSPEYLCIDFGRCNMFELFEMSRRFTDLCMGRHVGSAMLKAGDNDPAGHHGLRDALLDMARSAQLRLDFKLALVPSTPPIAGADDSMPNPAGPTNRMSLAKIGSNGR